MYIPVPCAQECNMTTVRSRPFIPEALESLQRALFKIDALDLPATSKKDLETILVRQAAKTVDTALPWQAGHSTATARYAVALGRALALEPDELHHLNLAGLLHDIGLMALPPSLSKTEALTADEYATVQSHP